MSASEHPSPAVLEALLRAELSAEERNAVLSHFARGCPSCSAAVAPAVCGEPLDPAESERYEEALDAAFSLFHERARDFAVERREAERFRRQVRNRVPVAHLPTLAACEVLLEESFALRYKDPAGMVWLARWAAVMAEDLDPERYGREALADLRARAWAECGNACRVANELEEAEAAFSRAAAALEKGTGDREVRARVAELAGSFHCYCRRYPEGFALLARARRLYSGAGDRNAAGRVLISQGVYARRAGDPREAEALLAAGLRMIDRERERPLVYGAFRNRVLILIDLGCYREARDLLPELRRVHEHGGAGRLDWVRLRWLEGKVAAGLGKLAAAEQAFLDCGREFEAEKMGFTAALVGLDLAVVWLRQGRTAELRARVDELALTFVALKVRPEALAATRLLQEAAHRDCATLELIEAVVDALQAAEPALPTQGGEA